MLFIHFGLYFFVFLLTESLINERAVTVFGASNVNYVYACGLIFTALGYLIFSFIKKDFDKKITAVSELLIFISIVGLIKINIPVPFLLLSYTCLFSLGYIGGQIHFKTSLQLTNRNFSLYLGISSMVGIILQFIVQNIGLSNDGYLITIELFLVLIILLSMHNESTLSNNLSIELSKINISVRTWVYIACVAIMSIILGFQDSIIVIKNATGELKLFSYVRLFYAFGLLVAGIIANIKDRIYLPLASGCAMILSVLSISFLRDTNTLYNVSMGIMYFYCGFYVMFMTVMFMELGLRRNNPRLYAGLGRVVRSITTCFVVLVTTVLTNYISESIYTVLSCILCMGLLVLMALSGILVPDKNDKKETDEQYDKRSFEDKLEEICTKYEFTPKEKESFKKLVTTEMGVQEIADEMCISRRVLQRHISAIYEKTGTKTRAGLFMLLNK